jgi:methylenetetrahydrofolate dehydrogenase (NADP+)/methenyltetrahydrofolate cyclohydrolase
MAAVIIDGKTAALEIRDDVKRRAAILREKGISPCLAVVLVGEDPASLSYVSAKEKALAEAEMESRDMRLPTDITETELVNLIIKLNNDIKIHGILVQLPLPRHIDADRIITAIDPSKDVDGFHPVSVGNMVLGRQGFIPCTPHGVLVLLKKLEALGAVSLSGSHAVVVGRSNIVGKPLANLLTRRDVNTTVTICHTGTKDLAYHTVHADIIIAAAGKAALIKPEMVRQGAVVIDVGVNRVPDATIKKGYRLCGDVDPTVAEKAGYLTPVPGGVGPMTIAMLLQNVIQAAEAVKL